MQTSFSENLFQAFSISQYDLCLQDKEINLKRKQLQIEYDVVFEDIRKQLGKNRKMMLTLERLQNEMSSMDDEWIYLQGFIDCVTLLKII
jgi:hypothetical protein